MLDQLKVCGSFACIRVKTIIRQRDVSKDVVSSSDFYSYKYIEEVNASVTREARCSERFSIWPAISRDSICVFDSLENKGNG